MGRIVNRIHHEWICELLLLALACSLALSEGRAAARERPRPEVTSPALDAVFVIDNSGSMKRNDPAFITRQVAVDFAAALSDGSRLGMVVFDRDARLIEPLTLLDSSAVRSRFAESLKQVDFRGQFTNSPAGIERAIYELKTKGRERASKVIVFLSDGIIDTGDPQRDREAGRWLREDLALESKQAGIRIFGVAFTDGADLQLIQTLALKTGGGYFRAYRAEEIPAVLGRILDAVAEPPERAAVSDRGAPEPESNAAFTTDGARATTAVSQPPGSRPSQTGDENTPDGARFSLVSLLMIIALVVSAAGGAGIFIAWYSRGSRPEFVPAPGERPDKSRKGRLLPAKRRKPDAKLIDVMRASREGVLPLHMDKARLSIGRDPSNDIVIPQSTISSLHASIEFKNGYFLLEDHRSTNGTSLNKQRLAPNQPVRLKNGDRIDFSNFEFSFLIPDHVPSGQTVILSASSLVSEDESSRLQTGPAGRPVGRDRLRECLESHLGRIAALGSHYERFVEQGFGPDLVDALLFKAGDLMQQSAVDHKGRHEAFAERGVLYVLCVIPEPVDNAAAWFGECFGGYSKLLEKFLGSHYFTQGGCRVLCVVTCGRDRDVWVAVTIAPGYDNQDPIDIMSVELLSEQERRKLAMNFNEIGQVV